VAETQQAENERGLSIGRTSSADLRILTVSGEIDEDAAPQLKQALVWDDATGAQRTVMDMREVTFMDSSGINALILAHQHAHSTQGWLRLAAATDPVLRVLRIVGLNHVIACHPTIQEALRG
jgi:stage II sporulation protein AA (anti-sigma F factor antagonist)